MISARGDTNQFSTEILAYCLMPNHVHIIAVPATEESLSKAISQTHLKYTRMINFREKWRGYLWQGRFSSYVFDERYLLAATRYILRNPVKAKMAKEPWDYRWSSAAHHIGVKRGSFLSNKFLDTLVNNWKEFLADDVEQKEVELFQ